MDERGEIQKRLVDRDSNLYPIKLIEEFQKKEVHYAQNIAKVLEVRCKILNCISNIDEMLIFLSSILEN